MTLDGLRKTAKESVKHLRKRGMKSKEFVPKINVVRYADDFVITCRSKGMLEKYVRPAIEAFLAERGLELHPTKTKIVHIRQGFNFLGFTFQAFRDESRAKGYSVLAKPSKKSMETLARKLRKIVKDGLALTAERLIYQLNPILRGWSNYFRCGTSKKKFVYIGKYLWVKLWGWARRKHRHHTNRELRKLYFLREAKRNWIFAGKNQESGNKVQLFDIANVMVTRHVMCKDLNPFLPENQEYYKNRERKGSKLGVVLDKYRVSILTKTQGICKVCSAPLISEESLEVHHVIPKSKGGKDHISNLIILHKECHKQVTNSKNSELLARFQAEGVTRGD